MSSDPSASFDAVWNTVQQWPVAERRSFASQILASLPSDPTGGSAQARPADLIGAWRSAGPLDDTALQTMLEEELLRKHS